MLSRVLNIISAHGWFDVSSPFEKSIHLTQGACLWLMLTRNGVCDTYVKFSDCTSLEQEAQRYASASRIYPSLVPPFVGYTEQAGINVLVCRAIDYVSLTADILKHRRSGVVRDLSDYFVLTGTPKLLPFPATVRNSEVVGILTEYFDAHSLGPLACKWLGSDIVRRATTLPDMPQHGDFVLNNIGRTRRGGAVVFDWEDFGASCLPGLDLFTLEVSLAGDAARLVSSRSHFGGPTRRFVRSACDSLRLDYREYDALTPLYALLFRYLKRNYGPGVRERMDRLLLDLERHAQSASQ